MFPFIFLFMAVAGGGVAWVVTKNLHATTPTTSNGAQVTTEPYNPQTLSTQVIVGSSSLHVNPPPLLTPSPQPVNVPVTQGSSADRITPTVGNTDSTAALAAQLAQQEAARLEAVKRQNAQALIDRIGATENLMKLDLVQLTALDSDNSKYPDYYAMALRDRGADRGVPGLFEAMTRPGVPEWEADVEACRKRVVAGCGINLFGACTNEWLPKCRLLTPNGDPTNPADQALRRAEMAYRTAQVAADQTATQQVSAWKKQQALPYEARLAERETQYRSMVAELNQTFGMSYMPRENAAHSRAISIMN